MQMEESIICPYSYITTACFEYVDSSTQRKMGWLMENGEAVQDTVSPIVPQSKVLAA